MIYEKMQDREQFKKFLYTLADNLAKKYDLPGWGDVMEAKIIKWIFDKMVDKITGTERTQTDRILSKDAEKGLWKYMNGPLKEQIFIERKNMPNDVTFVFGHTHKPFEEDMNFKEYPLWVNVYNTGGWIIESVEPKPLHGGAVILVDEELNVVSMRMYNEDDNPENYSVRVEEATHAGEEKNPFYHQIRKLVKASEDPWKTFSATVARSVRVRAQNLRARIIERD